MASCAMPGMFQHTPIPWNNDTNAQNWSSFFHVMSQPVWHHDKFDFLLWFYFHILLPSCLYHFFCLVSLSVVCFWDLLLGSLFCFSWLSCSFYMYIQMKEITDMIEDFILNFKLKWCDSLVYWHHFHIHLSINLNRQYLHNVTYVLCIVTVKTINGLSAKIAQNGVDCL